MVQNFEHVQNKSIIYRPLQTFQDQEKLLDGVNLRYLKTLKTRKLNTKIPQIKHCSCSKFVMICRSDLQT